MIGFVEVITLLLGLAGFGLQPNPRPATPDQALQYAIADADIVVHLDVASVVPGNFQALLALPNQPQIKASPELAKVVKQVLAEVEGARGMAKTSTGIDLATDITDATLFVQIVPGGGDPNAIASVRGKLPMSVIDKIGKMTKKQPSKVGGGMMLELGGKDPAIAITKDGVMLAGTPKLVRERLADGWKSPPRAANTALGYAQDMIGGKPVFGAVFTPSVNARKELLAKLGPKKNFLTDLAQRHKLFTISVFHDGIGWTWLDTTKAGLDQMALMSEGAIELLRASHIAPRGVAKIALGALESYKGTDKRIDEILKRKADLMKVVESYTGDGNFKAAVTKDVTKLRLDVRATGKTFSEVVPLGFVAPAAGVLLLGRATVTPPPPPTAVTPAQPRKQ
ncbi:MAG: hypothetical protein ABI867_31410 [Kofleriaceae bacterium]